MINAFPTFDEQFEELFIAIHKAEVFEDSKTIVDLIPKATPAVILKSYREALQTKAFDIKAFVAENFEIPTLKSSDFRSDTSQSVQEHCQRLWPFLMRERDEQIEGSSLIPLPHPYIVPGGRFAEVYYWDSFFTMRGLLKTGHTKTVKHMIDNFCHLIETMGFIPNGNRTYYHTRSQPPFFSLMVQMLVNAMDDKSLWQTYLPYLEKEYAFWMHGKDELKPGQEKYHLVRFSDGTYLNRYYSFSDKPREESYVEDVALAAHLTSEEEKSTLYKELRAGAESGWDYSSRWLDNPNDLSSIRILSLVPVDLNTLMYALERNLARAYKQVDKERRKYYKKLAKERKHTINKHCWSGNLEYYGDFDLKAHGLVPQKTLAMVFPLFQKIASKEQAAKIALILERQFLKEGGLVTTLKNSGQQWDAPNGWAPLQWIAVEGLKKYDHHLLAKKIQKRWMSANESVFKSTGKMLEKYNVEDTQGSVGGGEYPVQDGFGWTNGVYLDWAMDNNE